MKTQHASKHEKMFEDTILNLISITEGQLNLRGIVIQLVAQLWRKQEWIFLNIISNFKILHKSSYFSNEYGQSLSIVRIDNLYHPRTIFFFYSISHSMLLYRQLFSIFNLYSFDILLLLYSFSTLPFLESVLSLFV